MKKMKKAYIAIIAVFTYGILSGEMSMKAHPTNNKQHTMVVFVHGTLFGLPTLKSLVELTAERRINFSSIVHGDIYQDFLDKSRYQYTYLQPINKPGLVKTDFLSLNDNQKMPYADSMIATALCNMHLELDEHKNRTFSCYTYGWSGKLDKKRRRKEALLMHSALVKQFEQVKRDFGSDAQLWILTHSHGANMTLNLAHHNQKAENKLLVNRLVNFGAPVQSETEKLIDNDMYQKIYHIYSPGDYVQILDTISTKDFFSRRNFGVIKSDKLVQIEVNVDATSPGHAELWFLGLSPIFYRRHLSIYPFPIAVYLPLLIDFANQQATKEPIIKLALHDSAGGLQLRQANGLAQKHYSYSDSWNQFRSVQKNLFTSNYSRQKAGITKILYATGLVGIGSYLLNAVIGKNKVKK